MPVAKTQDRVILKHPKGSSVEVLLYGATVISWKSGTEPVERLFLSSKAALDGTKPVRGGIPIVFPCFGAPTHPEHFKLGQHGFARNQVWKWDDVMMDNDAGVSIRLTLEPTEKIAAVYARPFKLGYVVTLAEHQLSTDLHVNNTSMSNVLEFQALFHNYIRAPSKDVLITPLQHTSYYDKTESTEQSRTTAKVETRGSVDVKQFTDSVYDDAPQQYQVTWPGGGLQLRTTNLKNLVIWNPLAEVGSKIGDMEEGGWERFVCVEPGFVRGFEKVEPGKTWIGHQVLSVAQEERLLSPL